MRAKKRGFTLVEMLVVVGILAILMGTLVSSFAAAERKARISRAAADCGEITKAILAYGNYVDTGIPTCDDAVAGEDTLSYILGAGTDRAGGRIPVLYNATLTNGKILDPWGKPYRVTVKALAPSSSQDQVGKNLKTGVYLPNRYGRRATASGSAAKK